MKTYILYTLCLQKLTVSRCSSYAHALEKAGLKASEVFKHEVVTSA